MRKLTIAVVLLFSAAAVSATTLEQLSLEQMVKQANLIVRGKALSATPVRYGAMIHTQYSIQVTETLKGSAAGTVSVGVPGGQLGALRQTIPGAPVLTLGQEYLVFIWTGPSGRNYVLGLTQGLFDVKRNAAGELVLLRGAAEVTMVDAAGREVKDAPVEMRLSDLRGRVPAPVEEQ